MSDFARSVQILIQIAEDLKRRSTENNRLLVSTARILKSYPSDNMTIMKFNSVRIERMDLDDELLNTINEQRKQSKITQIKLMNHFGNDTMKMQEPRSYKREAALEQLRETLGRESIRFSDPEHPDNEIEDELNQIKMKLNSAGKMTLQAARAQLKRTQSLLFKRRP